MKLKRRLAGLLAALAGASAYADIKVGVTVSITGPAAALGMAEKNALALMPSRIAGEKVHYLVLDDASDPGGALRNVRQLIAEERVDAIVGSTTTSNSLAIVDAAAEGETPLISLAAAARLVEPMDAKRAWVFKTPPNDAQMATAIVEHMTSNHVKTVAYLGFSDAYGEGWWQRFAPIAEARKLRIVGNERFRRTDTSVTGQVLTLLAAEPDAVFVGGAGAPAALPPKALREKGYKGLIYQTHGAASADFLRACGPACEGALLPAGPVLVAAQLPDSNPVRKAALDYLSRYEASYGQGSASAFGAYAWDAGLLLGRALPLALKKAQPGSRAFRQALREALEGTQNLVAAQGVFNLSPRDHLGLDQRARVMVKVEGGAWKLAR